MINPNDRRKEKMFDIKIKLNNVKGTSDDGVVRAIHKLLKEYSINPSSIIIKDCDKYKDCPKITLKNMESQLGLPKDRILVSGEINWYQISKNIDMSEGFIRFAADKLMAPIIIDRILKGELKVSKKFREEFKEDFKEYEDEYAEDFLNGDLQFFASDAYQDIIENELNNESKPKTGGIYNYNGEIQHPNGRDDNSLDQRHPRYRPNPNIPPDINDMKNKLANVFGIDPNNISIGYYNMHGNGMGMPPSFFPPEEYMNMYNDEYEESEPLEKTYITLDNYRQKLIDIDTYDCYMWSWVSSELWLSPEFVDKFWNKIHPAELMNENEHFNSLMKCDWFFDKYIDIFKRIKKSSVTKIKNRVILDADKNKIPANEL